MAENSKIEWCDHTVNLWWGCTKVHRGCDNCYAETLSNRWGNDVWGNDKPRKRIKSAFKDLDKYQKKAKKTGVFAKVFVGSMMDIFEKPMPLLNPTDTFKTTEHLQFELFKRIHYGHYPNLIFLLLTKRPSNINKYIPFTWYISKPPSNVWFGTSPVDQKTYGNLLAHLSRVDGNKFRSVEPQLEHIDLTETDGIKWIIQGGESGPKKRPFDLSWAHSLRAQCKAQNIPYFFKQIDKVQAIPDDMMIREFPNFKYQ